MAATEGDQQERTAQPGGHTSGQSAARFCGHCGSAVEPERQFCPACGALVATPSSAPDATVTVVGGAVSAPAPQAAEMPSAWVAGPPPGAPPPPAAAPPPPLPHGAAGANPTPYAATLTAAPPPPAPTGWDDDLFEVTQPAGMARAAYTPINPNAQRRRPRHRVLAAISTLLLLAVLATTGFWLYGVFAAHQETAAARFVPTNTILFAGIDTVQAVKNGHHVSSTDLGNGTGQGDALKQVTGLDWNNDVLPWLGRDIAFAVFPHQPPAASEGPFQTIGYVYLLQSRDDSAAQAAMKKAANFQTRQGNNISTSSYGGFTLYSVTPNFGIQSGTVYGPGVGSAPATGPSGSSTSSTVLSGPITGTTVTAGKGWALVASDSASAQAVIDRINAGGNGLDTTAAFQAATRDLPSDRFGTFFLNLRAYATAVVPAGNAQPDIPFLDDYPAAGGYAEWTNSGVRGVIELPGQRPVTVPDLSGDTTSLAKMIPATALAYSGAANLGAAYKAVESLTPAPTNGAPPPDAFAQYFGQSANNPVFQQPAAVAMLRQGGASQPGQVPGEVGLIRAPDAAAASAALKATAQAQNWTLKPTTVSGTPATEIYASVPQPVYLAPPTPPSSQGSPPVPVPAPVQTYATEMVGVAAQVQGTFVIAGSTEDLAAVLAVASGAAPSLGASAAFQQLVAAAPSGAISTSYVNLAALLSHTPPPSGGSGSDLLNRSTSLLVTAIWSQSQIAITADVQLQG